MTHATRTAGGSATGAPTAVDFFVMEASDVLGQLDTLVARSGDGGPRGADADTLARMTRALRGAATMARQTALAELAGALEKVAVGVRDCAVAWTPAAADAVVAALDAFKTLLRRVRAWTDADAARARTHADELRALTATASSADARGATITAAVVPIARLFFDDAGPHIVHRDAQPPITVDQRFRQAAVPLASSLRRLIGEARASGSDDGAQATLGVDLRAALGDLGELAESYGIAPVVNFAAARMDAISRMDPRALDVVDGAAQSLIESAGVAWTRPTPPASVSVIAAPPSPPAPPAPPVVSAPPATLEPPAPAEAPSEAPVAPAPPPASGQALAALIESSLSSVDAFGVIEPDGAAPADAPPAASLESIDQYVYRGRAALRRAREVRDALRESPTPEPALLAELYDLIDLAALDEPTATMHA